MRINGPGNHPSSAVLGKGFHQIFPNDHSQLFRFQNDSIRSEAEDPALDFVQSSHSEGNLQTAIREFGDLLAFVPDLLSYPPGQILTFTV